LVDEEPAHLRRARSALPLVLDHERDRDVSRETVVVTVKLSPGSAELGGLLTAVTSKSGLLWAATPGVAR